MARYKLVRTDGSEEVIDADHHTLVGEIRTFWQGDTDGPVAYMLREIDVASIQELPNSAQPTG